MESRGQRRVTCAAATGTLRRARPPARDARTPMHHPTCSVGGWGSGEAGELGAGDEGLEAQIPIRRQPSPAPSPRTPGFQVPSTNCVVAGRALFGSLLMCAALVTAASRADATDTLELQVGGAGDAAGRTGGAHDRRAGLDRVRVCRGVRSRDTGRSRRCSRLARAGRTRSRRQAWRPRGHGNGANAEGRADRHERC